VDIGSRGVCKKKSGFDAHPINPADDARLLALLAQMGQQR